MIIFALGRFPTGWTAPFTAENGVFTIALFYLRRSFHRILAGRPITIRKAASATQLFCF